MKKITDKVRLPSALFQSFHSVVIAALLTSVVAVVTGRADVVYVANEAGGTIDAINSAGVSSVFATTPGGVDAFGLAFDSGGNLYVGTINEILKYTPGGAESVFANNGLDDPAGLAFDKAGNLYVANAANNTIEEFTPGGGGNVFASTGLSAPTGLAFDSAGNLYVANSGNNTIEKFTSSGVGSLFASNPSGSLSVLDGPQGLAFDSAGNLYVANYFSDTVERFTTGGIASTFAGSGLNFPVGLAFDSAGNLYVANNSPLGDNIEKFSSTTGVGSVFAGGLSQPQYLALTNNAGQPLSLPVPEVPTWGMVLAGFLVLLGMMRLKSIQPKVRSAG
jgi:secreted PhoX family phosphatase